MKFQDNHLTKHLRCPSYDKAAHFGANIATPFRATNSMCTQKTIQSDIGWYTPDPNNRCHKAV